MNKFKRITAAFLAVLTIGSFAPLGGCGGDPDDSSSSSVPLTECDKKGHEYSEKTGLCVRCNKAPEIPPIAQNQKFPLVEPCTHDGGGFCPECDYQGSGENEYDRVELFEDCYTVEIGNKGVLWLSFSVKKAGQYLLQSVDGDNGVQVTSHAANEQYVNPKGIDAIKKDNNFYSYVNCGEGYFNAQWRATYCFKAPKGTQVKIRFIRIDEPAWEPKSVHTFVYANELSEKAQNMPDDKELTEVPFDSDYFFDATSGYYRMGTQANPGEIIYVAIDRAAPRLFGETTDGEETMKFTNLLKTSGTALNLNNGVTENGDYSILCYTPFIMNWVNENDSWGSRPGSTATEPEGDPNKVCYQNFCNDDGVYPVNNELFQFLNLYVLENSPMDREGVAADALWLAPCYYYAQSKDGTESNPKVLLTGSNSITLTDPASYYVIEGTGSYTLSCTVDGVKYIADGSIVDLTEITVAGGKVFRLRDAEYENVTITVTVTKNS